MDRLRQLADKHGLPWYLVVDLKAPRDMAPDQLETYIGDIASLVRARGVCSPNTDLTRYGGEDFPTLEPFDDDDISKFDLRGD